MERLAMICEEIFILVILLSIFCLVAFVVISMPLCLETGHNSIGRSQAATTATTPPTEGTKPSVKTVASTPHPKSPHSHIHACEMGGHFVVEVHASSLEERQKILNKTFEDWRRLNADKWQPHALSLHIWARPVQSSASTPSK